MDHATHDTTPHDWLTYPAASAGHGTEWACRRCGKTFNPHIEHLAQADPDAVSSSPCPLHPLYGTSGCPDNGDFHVIRVFAPTGDPA